MRAEQGTGLTREPTTRARRTPSSLPNAALSKPTHRLAGFAPFPWITAELARVLAAAASWGFAHSVYFLLPAYMDAELGVGASSIGMVAAICVGPLSATTGSFFSEDLHIKNSGPEVNIVFMAYRVVFRASEGVQMRYKIIGDICP